MTCLAQRLGTDESLKPVLQHEHALAVGWLQVNKLAESCVLVLDFLSRCHSLSHRLQRLNSLESCSSVGDRATKKNVCTGTTALAILTPTVPTKQPRQTRVLNCSSHVEKSSPSP